MGGGEHKPLPPQSFKDCFDEDEASFSFAAVLTHEKSWQARQAPCQHGMRKGGGDGPGFAAGVL